MDGSEVKKRAADWCKKIGAYKYVLLVIAAGILLLIWPESEQKTAEVASSTEEVYSVEQIEEKLENILGRIHGAGQVSVALTVKNGVEYIYAQDSETESNGESAETVVISTGSGKQEVVVQTLIYPTYQGALVVCEGGDDPEVILLITQAVSSLTGLGSARITVCKGE